jgi:hypothetical protein|tara:strand:+ start:2755 stop:3747 length:993 start_codon:yes stop_codon:yes gene_type:complete
MAKNHLTGTVRAPAYFGPLGNQPVDNIISGELHGDGTNITNVARVVSNGTTDLLLSVGAGSQDLVGEPNLQFNGSRLHVIGDVTASAINLASLNSGTGLTSSYLALDANNNVIITSSIGSGGGGSASGQGPVGSIQFNTGSGGISGSANLTFTSDTLFVTGNLIVSGNIEANTFEIISTTVTEINQSGSTAFGDTNDDTHHFTGSLSVFSSSTDLFAIDVENKTTKIKTGLTFNRVAVTSNYSVLKSDYYVGINTASPSAIITASLPNASTLNNGQTFVFKDEGGAANSFNIVISASSGQTIDNQNQVILESPHASLTIYTDGSSKFFIT